MVSFLVLEHELTNTGVSLTSQFFWFRLQIFIRQKYSCATYWVCSNWPSAAKVGISHSYTQFVGTFRICWDSFHEENYNCLPKCDGYMKCTCKHSIPMAHFIPCLFLFTASKFTSPKGQCETLSFSHTFWWLIMMFMSAVLFLAGTILI